VEAALIVSAAEPPAEVTVADAALQVNPEPEHVSETGPVNPPDGVTVTVDTALEPGPPVISTAVAASAIAGVEALTVTGIVAVEVSLPVAASVPVTVME
jgi:hypothetical protein